MDKYHGIDWSVNAKVLFTTNKLEDCTIGDGVRNVPAVCSAT
jgi:hypothetical protein